MSERSIHRELYENIVTFKFLTTDVDDTEDQMYQKLLKKKIEKWKKKTAEGDGWDDNFF